MAVETRLEERYTVKVTDLDEPAIEHTTSEGPKGTIRWVPTIAVFTWERVTDGDWELRVSGIYCRQELVSGELGRNHKTFCFLVDPTESTMPEIERPAFMDQLEAEHHPHKYD